MVTTYYLDGSTIITEKNSKNTIIYKHDENGRYVGFNLNGTDYYYAYNAQGDVMGIYSTNGAFVARYTYDPWGKVLSVSDANGNAITSSTHVGNINPIRYRGYYYDSETGLYYLNSRYYDPTVGRFVNADAFIAANDDMDTFNMYVYCGNNPINRVDHSGHCYGYANDPNLNSRNSGVPYGYNCGSYGRHVRNPRNSSTSPVVGSYNPKDDPPDHPDYKPPKKGNQKVKNPNGEGRGWRAKDGGVWVWTPNMHGGDGWTIQYPGGDHSHAYPGGKVRNHFEAEHSVGVSTIMVFAGAVFTGILVMDDFTGIGAADDPLIAGSTACLVGGLDGLSGKKVCTECGAVRYGF